MIRVLLVGKDYVFRKALRLLLATASDMEVVGQVGELRDVPVLANVLKPDAVVIDAWKGQLPTRQLIHTLDRNSRNLPMVILHAPGDKRSLQSCAGNTSFLCKDAANDALIHTIYRIVRGPPHSEAPRGQEP